MSKYEYTVNGVDYNVEIESIENNIAVVTVNGKTFEIEMKEAFKAPRHLRSHKHRQLLRQHLHQHQRPLQQPLP